jgi:hypothetical protein
LPSLLQQRDKVVDSQHDVSNELIFRHANVSDGNTETQNLLKLELDRGTDFSDLVCKIFRVRDRSRELSGCFMSLIPVIIINTYLSTDPGPRDEESA